nr:EAL domain-containing protein [Lachnospiraceae bacterium]
YQPVYTKDGRQMYSAESLIRLNDPEFGELFPGEFIPAAERNGMIEQLGEYTLEEVCGFLESGIPKKLGIHYINVNLSVVQCMNPDFVSRVKKIVSRYQVEPSWINFEITETVAALDYVSLDAVIRELKAEGFMFSMEGYGTGFSNLYSIFLLDFDMIKMDKRLLWEAQRSEDGWTIFENSIRMVHELNHEVVVVGIETKEQYEKSKLLSVDWYQGNYFSRPLSRSELECMMS